MIEKNKLTQEYYLNIMSMFLKNSYGMIDREEIYRAILNNVNDVGKQFIYALDVFQKDEDLYFSRINYDKKSVVGPMLDIIASFYGISRSISVTYDTTLQTNITENIILSNEDLKYYLKTIIAKINYQGTHEELDKLYNGDITYSYDPDNKLTCIVTPTNPKFGNNTNPTNLGKLMLSDKIIIESMGIIYKKHLGDVEIALFDSGRFDSPYYVFDGE